MIVYQIGDVVVIKKDLVEVNKDQRKQLENNNYIGTIQDYWSGDNYPFYLAEYDFAFCENDFVGKLIENRIVRCE